jgi:hypothetical protein
MFFLRQRLKSLKSLSNHPPGRWRPDAQRAHERLLADAAAVAVAGWDGRFGGVVSSHWMLCNKTCMYQAVTSAL